ncbi:MAG: Do family serine endopeptidase [Gammaproteobacteria bacterium]|nr:Do family serine endopeptidase [Gammaproteobacteria bacterium]
MPDFAALAERVNPVVVNISTVTHGSDVPVIDELPEATPYDDLFRRFFDDNEPAESMPDTSALGSGVIVSDDGFILTNFHVIRGADEIIVRLADRRQLRAEVIGVDVPSDLALLKVEADSLVAADIGDADKVRVGEWVMAIGSPFGFDYSVTSGIVSAKGRSVGTERYVPYLQTDVAINPGNSGGPLFDLDGRVVGINSQIYSRTGGFMGVSFAIPINLAMQVAAQLKETGKVSRGWLGVDIQDVTRELAESFGMSRPEGALVRSVFDGSPAAAAGLEVGDIILAVNERAVFTAGELPPLVGATSAGESLRMRVLRDGQQVDVEATLDELPVQPVPARDEPPVRDAGLMGLGVRDLRLGERNALNLEAGGVLVERVAAGPAYQAGIRAGDVILSVDRQSIDNAEKFESVVGSLPLNRHVAVLIWRDNSTLFLPVQLQRQ